VRDVRTITRRPGTAPATVGEAMAPGHVLER
jgi:hypothetical protein